MSDLDIINTLSAEPIRPPEFKTLNDIITEYPLFDINSPTLYHLYLTFNNKYLSDDEKAKIEIVINKLRMEQTLTNRENIAYMERHKVMNVDTINE